MSRLETKVPSARPRAVLSHLEVSRLLPPSLALFAAEPNHLWVGEAAREEPGPLHAAGRQPAIEGSCGSGQRTAVTFTTVEKLAAGSPASFAEGTE